MISVVDSITRCTKRNLKCLILCPLSVLETWKEEIDYSDAVKGSAVFVHGSKEERANCYKSSLHSIGPVTIVTNYETLIHDRETFFGKTFDLLVVDEAHRLKNSNAVLYKILFDEVQFEVTILLTGTPIQNNLTELYSLLSLIDAKQFPANNVDSFVNEHEVRNGCSNEKLLSVLKQYVLRRTKSDVLLKLPPKTQVLMYHGLTSIQKKLYKSILLKDSEALFSLSNENANTSKRSLTNILMQLRKCCLHPYLFHGVEPEPFVIGDHLILASQKLVLLDLLLGYLLPLKHKVLIFSQFITMLDILQDYLEYKCLLYERLDGSSRSEERFLSIKNFNKNETTSVFLISTKAGGQGITLTSADTVIFYDNDFNPQNDIQAAARAHRIGQTKPVKIIKLVCKNSVEEIIIARAQKKFQLSSDVLNTGDLQGTDSNMESAQTPSEISEVVKFGLDVILSDVESTDNLNVDFEQILGSTDSKGCWKELETAENELNSDALKVSEDTAPETMYDFEGENFKSKMKQSDDVLGSLMASLVVEAPNLNIKAIGRPKRTLTAEERKERELEMRQNEAKRARILEEQKTERAEKRKQKLEALWIESGYSSLKLDNEVISSDERERSWEDENSGAIRFVSGDVTNPDFDRTTGEFAVIIHCVDNSGGWGEGGLFSALNKLSPEIGQKYETSYEMKDLTFGDTHLIMLNELSVYIALIVAQKRSSKGVLSDIDTSILDKSFSQIASFAKNKAKNGSKPSIHSPRLGHLMKNFNWYCAERLMRKHFAGNGLQIYVYYFSKNRQSNKKKKESTLNGNSRELTQLYEEINCETTGTTENLDVDGGSLQADHTFDVNKKASCALPSVFSGLTFELSQFLTEDLKTELTRYIIAYNGDIVDSELAQNGDIYVSEKNEMFDSDRPSVISSTDLVKCIKTKSKPKF